jgi:hypothetical protein
VTTGAPAARVARRKPADRARDRDMALRLGRGGRRPTIDCLQHWLETRRELRLYIPFGQVRDPHDRPRSNDAAGNDSR